MRVCTYYIAAASWKKGTIREFIVLDISGLATVHPFDKLEEREECNFFVFVVLIMQRSLACDQWR